MRHLKVALFTFAAVVLGGSGIARAVPPAETSLNTCQDNVRNQSRTLGLKYQIAVGTCLKAVANDVIKKNVPISAPTSKTCVAQFRKIYDSRATPPYRDLSAKLRSKVEKKCEPGFTPSVTHALGDILGAGGGTAEDITTINSNGWCKHYGGDGSIDSVSEWEDCLIAAQECSAAAAIAAQYPRATEWIADLLMPANMPAVVPPAADPAKTADALTAAGAFSSLIDPDGDGLNSPKCGGDAVACVKGCCYIESPSMAAGAPGETSCIEYTAPAAKLPSIGAACFLAGGFPVPGLTHEATFIPGPCVSGPTWGGSCIGGINLSVMPADSDCP